MMSFIPITTLLYTTISLNNNNPTRHNRLNIQIILTPYYDILIVNCVVIYERLKYYISAVYTLEFKVSASVTRKIVVSFIER